MKFLTYLMTPKKIRKELKKIQDTAFYEESKKLAVVKGKSDAKKVYAEE